jgi:Bacterial Ig-like domain
VIAVGILLLAACARIEPPPGGPPDDTPPRLIATVPDSLKRLPAFKGEVEFRFDEVISEGGSPSTGTGTGDLEKLVILSPTNRVPDVNWRRSRITVRPDEGWKPARVYRVQLLPGVTDLQRNRAEGGAVVTFTTGAPLPTAKLEGRVVDWRSRRPAPAALIVATLLPDSLPYRVVADSNGRFSFGPLPAGEYLVSGVLDENHNLQAEGREAYDTVRVRPGATNAGELWAFEHDTTPPRIRTVTMTDSVAATAEISQMLDPKQRFEARAATLLLLPDSTPVPVTSLLPKPVDDSLHRPAGARPDTAAARDTAATADTLRRRPVGPPRPRGPPAGEQELTGRPPLTDRLVLRVGKPWKPGDRYVVEIRGVRNVSGVAGNLQGNLVIPEKTAADSLKGLKPDSAARRADSLKRAPRKRS